MHKAKHCKRIVFGIIILVHLLFSSCSKDSTGIDNRTKHLPEEQLQSILDNYQQKTDGILGMVHHIVMSGYESWGGATGHFDLTRTQPLLWNDKFLIGSTTKSFTATLVLQLWEEGIFELEEVIIDYVSPDIAAILENIPNGSQVTIRQALMHRSGIWNYTWSLPLIENIYNNPGYNWSVVELLQIVQNEGWSVFQPGESYSYSNTNYLLLGCLIEFVTGQIYADVLRERILNPQELDNTFLPDQIPVTYGDIAHGYEDDFHSIMGGATLDALNLNCGSAWGGSAGGLVSTTEDINSFYRALVRGDLFQNKSTFPMMKDLVNNETYAMGLFIGNHPRLGPFISHGGIMTGFDSYAYYFLNHDIAINGCINLDGSVEYILPETELVDLLLDVLAGIITK